MDQSGVAVAGMAAHGKGKVVCFADDAAYWDFCAQRDKDLRVPNVPTTVALFKCLIPDKKPGGEGPPVVRLPAERELDLAGLLVRYSNPVASRAKPLLDVLPRVAGLVAKALGYPDDADRERRSWQEQMDRAESGGKKLDITLADTDRRLFGPCEAKMMWMIERLESKYGADFMPRFLEICRALKGR
jgi:hypothetical protein